MIEIVSEVLSARPSVVAAYLFGSAARRSPQPGDLDIAVMLTGDADGLGEAVALNVELERRLDFPTDVHDFDALPLDLQFRVLDEGVILVDRDPPARVRREIAAQLAYYDFRPYLDRIRDGALRRVASPAPHG